jgi:broad specificity phosphatase PhoE
MIILFRHAKPIIDYSSCKYDRAIDRLNDYNSTLDLKFDDLESLSDELKTILLQNNPVIVYSSKLPRTIATADYIFNPLEISVNNNPIFSEFELDILKIPKLKLSVQIWFFISRIAWILGIRNRAKSIFHEINRSKIAAKILEKHYYDNTTVILVGHARMNKYIAKYFQQHGFHVTKRKQNDFYTILKK